MIWKEYIFINEKSNDIILGKREKNPSIIFIFNTWEIDLKLSNLVSDQLRESPLFLRITLEDNSVSFEKLFSLEQELLSINDTQLQETEGAFPWKEKFLVR